METKPFRDRVANRESRPVTIRLTEREIGFGETIETHMKFRSFSEAIRESFILGGSLMLKDSNLDPDVIKYADVRIAKLATEFRAYGLTAVVVEQERVAEVEKSCEWCFARDRLESGFAAISEMIAEARKNLEKPEIGEAVRKSLDEILVDLELRYKSKYGIKEV